MSTLAQVTEDILSPEEVDALDLPEDDLVLSKTDLLSSEDIDALNDDADSILLLSESKATPESPIVQQTDDGDDYPTFQNISQENGVLVEEDQVDQADDESLQVLDIQVQSSRYIEEEGRQLLSYFSITTPHFLFRG